MSIFEGADDPPVDLGELSAASHQDLRLDPLRHAIGALLDDTRTRVGTIVTEVETWWDQKGVLRPRDVDPTEVVAIEVGFDPVELDTDGYPVVLPWVDASLEPGDEDLDDLLAGRLHYPGRDLAVVWFEAGEAARERMAWDTRYDVPDGPA